MACGMFKYSFFPPRRMALRAGLCLAAVAALVLSIRPPAPAEIAFGPRQEVHTTTPILGVHTRLTDEVEPWKIQYTLRLVRQMGAPWIVEFFPWAYLEYNPQTFDWSHADEVIDHARAQGLTVITRLGLVPWWARPDERVQPTTFNYLDRDHYADFGDFVHAFVEHYKGRVQHIIIWNEPNLSFEWGMRRVDAAAYVDLLKVAYQRAKEANPNIVVLAGALAPTLEPIDSERGLDDLIYLQQMYAAGAQDYFDALAAHAYGLTRPMADPPDPARVNFRRVELLRQIMIDHGDAAKQVYITEAGWNDHPRWTRAVRPAQRIRYTLRAYELAKEWPWLESLSIWAFRYPWLEKNMRDYYTFVSPDFQPKGIYLEVQQALGGGG